MRPGGKDRSPCPASQGQHAMDETLQSISAAIFVLLSYGKFQTYANVLKPFLDTFSVPGTVMPLGTSLCLKETLTSWSPRLSGGHGIQPTSSIRESVVWSGHGWTHWIPRDTAAVLSRPDHALSQSPLQTPGGAGPAPTGGVSLTSGTGHSALVSK